MREGWQRWRNLLQLKAPNNGENPDAHLNEYDSHSENLQSVIDRGIIPLTARKILGFNNLRQRVDTLVLFDSPGTITGTGNHWRITEITQGTVTLQPCSPAGFVDESSDEFHIDMDEPYFTGASITTNSSDEIYWTSELQDHLGLQDSQCIPS